MTEHEERIRIANIEADTRLKEAMIKRVNAETERIKQETVLLKQKLKTEKMSLADLFASMSGLDTDDEEES